MIEAVFFDWGDTLMRDFRVYPGSMAHWPRVQAMPGAGRALRALAPRYRLAVATNADDSGEALVFEALARVGLQRHISFVVSSCEVGWRKPEPEFFAAALTRAACAAAAAVMVGDSLTNDVGGAQDVGMRTVWVDLDGAGAPPDAPRPDAVIRSLAELPQVLPLLERRG